MSKSKTKTFHEDETTLQDVVDWIFDNVKYEHEGYCEEDKIGGVEIITDGNLQITIKQGN